MLANDQPKLVHRNCLHVLLLCSTDAMFVLFVIAIYRPGQAPTEAVVVDDDDDGMRIYHATD